jgi:hypothetical protein
MTFEKRGEALATFSYNRGYDVIFQWSRGSYEDGELYWWNTRLNSLVIWGQEERE